jgi:hypothetical protein
MSGGFGKHNIGALIEGAQAGAFATAGTATASKPLVLDANKHVNEIRTTSLYIGATGAEVLVPGAVLAGGIASATITVGAEAANVINVAIQLKDAAAADLARRGFVQAYLSDDANGDSIVATAPDTVAIGTDGLYIPLISAKRFDLVSEADGNIDINITKSGADTFYLVLIIGDKLTVSGAITFDATT